MLLIVLVLLTCAVPVAMLASLWRPIAPLDAVRTTRVPVRRPATRHFQ